MIRSHFAGDISEQGDMACKKAVSIGWCKESSHFTV